MARQILVEKIGTGTKSTVTEDSRTIVHYGGLIIDQSGSSITIEFPNKIPVIFEYSEFTNNFGKLDAAEIAEDGQIIKRGKQRIATYYPIPIRKRSIVGATPGSTDIHWANNIEAVGIENTFVNNKNDSFMIEGTVPEGFDTSIPFQLRVWWYATASGGDIEAIIDYAQHRLGDPVDGTIQSVRSTTILTVAPGEENIWKEVVFPLNVNKLKSGDRFTVRLSRDSTNGNPNDTLSGATVLTIPSVLGTRWKL